MRCISDIRYMLYANVICSMLVHKKANLYHKSWVMIQSCYCQKSRFIQHINLSNIKLKLDVRYLSWATETRSIKRSYEIRQYCPKPLHWLYRNSLVCIMMQFIYFRIKGKFKKLGILKKNIQLIFDRFKVTSDTFFVFACNGIYDLQAE